VVTALAVGAGAVLLVHFLARHGVSWARKAVYVLWFAAAMGGIAAAGYMIHCWPLGTWTAEQLFWGLLLAAVVLRILTALASPSSWLIRR
jgi:hypothetical protein